MLRAHVKTVGASEQQPPLAQNLGMCLVVYRHVQVCDPGTGLGDRKGVATPRLTHRQCEECEACEACLQSRSSKPNLALQ